MTSTRFDPYPDKPYGFCFTCKEQGVTLDFATRDEMNAHLSKSFDEAKAAGRSSGHSGRSTNPSREERIRSAISMDISSAMSSLMDELDDYTHGRDPDASSEEITAALKYESVALADEWKQYIEEGDG